MKCFNKCVLAGALCLGGLSGQAALAATHALVVGINDYQFFPPYDAANASEGVYDLLGAVNDANLIAFSLQKAGVSLPEDRILINERATVDSFLTAWEQMKAGAAPGDTLLITFAGHGAQETEAIAPFDEEDGRDEIIMFHEFDPARPGVGRLSDDELFTLMADAQEYNIVWVMDSCHSGGLVRSAAFTVSRFGGLFDGLPEPSLSSVPMDGTSDAEAMAMPHVTQILATESEFLRVNETRIDGEMHGALSWHFAEAVSGEADRDMDQVLSRGELRDFLTERVFSRMNQSQQPSILPAGDDAVLVSLGGETTPVTAPAPVAREEVLIAVNFEGGRPPGLDTERVTRVRTGAELTFRAVSDSKWEVFNHTGDRITSIETVPSDESLAAAWPQSAAPLLDRAEVLAALAARVEQSGGGGALTAAHGGALLRLGEDASFTYRPPSEALRYLTMFNIASNGVVQPLHPTGGGDGAVSDEGLTLTFEVRPPLGADQLVAIGCPAQPVAFQARLQNMADQAATPSLVQDPALADCSFATLGVFTQYVRAKIFRRKILADGMCFGVMTLKMACRPV